MLNRNQNQKSKKCQWYVSNSDLGMDDSNPVSDFETMLSSGLFTLADLRRLRTALRLHGIVSGVYTRGNGPYGVDKPGCVVYHLTGGLVASKEGLLRWIREEDFSDQFAFAIRRFIRYVDAGRVDGAAIEEALTAAIDRQSEGGPVRITGEPFPDSPAAARHRRLPGADRRWAPTAGWSGCDRLAVLC